MPEIPDDAPPDTSARGRPMTPIYVAVVIVEVIVLACLWWMTEHFQ